MSDPVRAARALSRMHVALRRMTTASLAGTGRYERATDSYQADLLRAYQRWYRGTLRNLPTEAEAAVAGISAQMPVLQQALGAIAQEQLPAAIQVLGSNYVPSPDAWTMVAETITSAQAAIGQLAQEVQARLERSITEGTDLLGVAQSLEPKVTQQAGYFWVLIQRAIGDFAAQAATRDDVIYRCRWVRVRDEASCPACKEYEGEYDSYEAMLQVTNQSVPGYFVNSPLRSCWGNCRCHLELFINGAWRRV